MDWLKQLRRASIRKSLFPFLLLAGLGAALLIFSGAWRVVGMLSPKTLAELTPETAVGAYVEDDIYFIYDYFISEQSYKENTPSVKTTTGRYYLIDFDETYYMALRVHRKELEEADAMMKACQNYMDDPAASFEDLPVYHVKGTVQAMDEEELGYYYGAVDSDPAYTEIMLPFYVEANCVGGLSLPALVILLLIAVFLLGMGFYCILTAVTGRDQKQVRQKLSAGGNLELEAERAGRFYEETEPVCGFRMGREYVHFREGSRDVLLRPWDIAWAYQSTTQHRTNGIPSGKSYAVVLRLMDGTTKTLSMGEKKVRELLEAMATALPGTVIGYDQRLEQLYRTNRQAFLDRWEEKVPGCTGRTQSPQDPARG